MSDRMTRSRLARTARVARLGARVGGTWAGTSARKVFASAERRIELDDRRRLATAEQVAAELGQMKGAMMKLGQMASYLDDGLPEPFRMALASLRNDGLYTPPSTQGSLFYPGNGGGNNIGKHWQGRQQRQRQRHRKSQWHLLENQK